MGFNKNHSGSSACHSTTSTGGVFTSLQINSSLTKQQYENVQVQKIIEEIFHPTLNDVFTNLIWENKTHHETLKDYIFRHYVHPAHIKKDYRTAFDSGQKNKIDTNPKCDRFDISLYYKSFLITAKYNPKLSSNPILMNELQNKLKAVKDIRNNLLHDLLIVCEADIDMYVTNLILLMKDILDLIGNIFGNKLETDKQKAIVLKGIKDIMKKKKLIISFCF